MRVRFGVGKAKLAGVRLLAALIKILALQKLPGYSSCGGRGVKPEEVSYGHLIPPAFHYGRNRSYGRTVDRLSSVASLNTTPPPPKRRQIGKNRTPPTHPNLLGRDPFLGIRGRGGV